ncbi:unnamed protein product [Moneuplotes crassus]|uniref:AP2/ERF domain-containing protein n=1 Tax=Euplotes crassus TaxID=5936 RepID=A0AAD2D241_EUPCR|nr:unnamed protein product [Moneuplotes crassus]
MNIFNTERPVLPGVFPARILPVPKCAGFPDLEGPHGLCEEDSNLVSIGNDIKLFLFGESNKLQPECPELPKLASLPKEGTKCRKSSTESSQLTADKEVTDSSSKKERKEVKGVEEGIFHRKFSELHSFLDTITDDNYDFIASKKKANYFKHDRRTKRRSGYRGVSRNGASWQVLMMINKVKTYIGCYETEEEGALVYDIVSILFKQQKARTNLSYSKSKLLDLLSYYDQDSKHFVCAVPERYLRELESNSAQ